MTLAGAVSQGASLFGACTSPPVHRLASELERLTLPPLRARPAMSHAVGVAGLAGTVTSIAGAADRGASQRYARVDVGQTGALVDGIRFAGAGLGGHHERLPDARAASTVRFSCASADDEQRASPAAWGEAMLVPCFTSSPVFHRGTVL